MLFIKLDITKVFDSIHWEYILEVLEHIVFCQRWHDILALIWGHHILMNPTQRGSQKPDQAWKGSSSGRPSLTVDVHPQH
jgi:hypothetical protein